MMKRVLLGLVLAGWVGVSVAEVASPEPPELAWRMVLVDSRMVAEGLWPLETDEGRLSCFRGGRWRLQGTHYPELDAPFQRLCRGQISGADLRHEVQGTRRYVPPRPTTSETPGSAAAPLRTPPSTVRPAVPGVVAPCVEHVAAYVRSDGTPVRAHTRRKRNCP